MGATSSTDCECNSDLSPRSDNAATRHSHANSNTACARFSDGYSGFNAAETATSASTTSLLSRPDASGPNSNAARPFLDFCTNSSTIARGSLARIGISRWRAVAATIKEMSCAASASVSKTWAVSIIDLPPAAIGKATGLGQPSRGLTIRKSRRPQFIIARAVAPIFSAICGRARITTGHSSIGIRSFIITSA